MATKKAMEVYRFGRLTKKGILPKNPSAMYTLEQHVRQGTSIRGGTQFLSCSYSMSGVISFLASHARSKTHNASRKTLAEILVEKQVNDSKKGARLALIESTDCLGQWHDAFNVECLDSTGSNWVQDQEEITLEGYVPNKAIIDKGLILVRDKKIIVWWRGEGSNYKEIVRLSTEARLRVNDLSNRGLLGEYPPIPGEPELV